MAPIGAWPLISVVYTSFAQRQEPGGFGNGGNVGLFFCMKVIQKTVGKLISAKIFFLEDICRYISLHSNLQWHSPIHQLSLFDHSFGACGTSPGTLRMGPDEGLVGTTPASAQWINHGTWWVLLERILDFSPFLGEDDTFRQISFEWIGTTSHKIPKKKSQGLHIGIDFVQHT